MSACADHLFSESFPKCSQEPGLGQASQELGVQSGVPMEKAGTQLLLLRKLELEVEPRLKPLTLIGKLMPQAESSCYTVYLSEKCQKEQELTPLVFMLHF